MTMRKPRSMREWAFARISRFKRRAPIFLHGAAGVLPRFRSLAKIAQHRVDRSLQFQVALPDRFLHVFPFTVGTQALKLLVRIEDQGGPAEAARCARTLGVHADHIQRLARKAE